MVWQDDVCVAFMDLFPLSEGHVLVVTIDTPVSGMRERDLRLGASALLGGTVAAGMILDRETGDGVKGHWDDESQTAGGHDRPDRLPEGFAAGHSV